MKSISELKSLYPKIIQKIQKQYDDWNQDDSGYDELVGYGGICHLIADDIIDVLQDNNIECVSYSLDSEVHVIVIAKFSEGVFSIDVPHYLYETGGGYNWTKKKNVSFDDSCIVYNKIFSDPERFSEYLDS